MTQSCVSRESSLTCWPLAHRAASQPAYQHYVFQALPQKHLWKIPFPRDIDLAASVCLNQGGHCCRWAWPCPGAAFSRGIHKPCGAHGEVLSSPPQHSYLSCRPDAFHKGSVPCTNTFLFIYSWLKGIYKHLTTLLSGDKSPTGAWSAT